MRPRPAWTRRRTNSCNKPSGRNFRTRPSSQLHTGKGRAARPFLIFPLLCWLFIIARVTRMNTIMDCERVLVLHAGKVVEFDTPAALCQMDRSIFQRMVGHRAEWVTLDALKFNDNNNLAAKQQLTFWSHTEPLFVVVEICIQLLLIKRSPEIFLDYRL